MPVTGTPQAEVFTIVEIFVDVGAPSLDVVFSKQVGGVESARIHFLMEGAAMGAIFGVPADATTPLGTFLNNAIYNAAITAGVISGTLS